MRPISLVFALWMALPSTVLAQREPMGPAEFTEHVAAQMRRDLQGVTVTVKEPMTIMLGDFEARLQRIYSFCLRTPTGCEQEVSNYVKGIGQMISQNSGLVSREAVRVVVRTRGYVNASQAAMSKDAPKLKARILTGGLVLLAAIDTPHSIGLYDTASATRLGLPVNEAFKVGLANTRKQLKPLMDVARVVRPGEFGHLKGDVYHSSRLALHDTWAPLAKAQGGKLIVAAPATDILIYVADDAPGAIKAMRTLAGQISNRAPNPLSDVLLRWTPTRWEVVR